MKENSLHAYLATSQDDQPFVRPVSPIIENDLTIWVTTFSTSKKVNHIEENPKICLVFVEQPQGDKAVFIFGDAGIVTIVRTRIEYGVWLALIFRSTFLMDQNRMNSAC
jgi:general stress protein 26